MLAFLQTNTPIVIFNQIVVTLLTVCFLYQVVFFVIGALRGEVAPPKAKKLHRYAFFIAAHNDTVHDRQTLSLLCVQIIRVMRIKRKNNVRAARTV